ncbi:SUMF1/EgtB/PvdO family nonheme iron enzyme, partial [bacterium]|nr:SUMF1/EgtB/PvdO family nonheme iron enzyme [bacterium]
MLQTLTIFFLLNSFCFCSPFKQDSSDQQKKFFNLFDSSNRTIDTSPPSPVYPALPSDFVKEIFTNRYHQTYVRIEVEKTRELIPRLLYGQAEVTQAQFEAVMSFNPSKVKNPDFPVSNVSMKDVSEYAAKISTSGEFYQVFDRENWLKALLVNQSTSYHFVNNPDMLGDYDW